MWPVSLQKKLDSLYLVRSSLLFTNSFKQAGFVQLLERVAVSVWMRSRVSAGLSKVWGYHFKRTLHWVSVKEIAVRVLEVRVERNDRLWRLYGYEVSKEKLERKRLGPDVILETTLASVKHLKKSLSSIDSENKLLEKTMRRYGLQKTVVRKSVQTLVKSLATRFVCM